jgi:hypothetical protein
MRVMGVVAHMPSWPYAIAPEPQGWVTRAQRSHRPVTPGLCLRA